MNYPSYSITIRTLGRAGEKYAATLKAIEGQTVKPEEVVIVIPEGYDLPKERLGYERFVRCKKGMVRQRVVGFDEMKSKYTLALDDDMDFHETFIEDLFNIAQKENADFIEAKIVDIDKSSAPPLNKVKSSIKNIVGWLIGISWSKNIGEYAVKIANTGGFITNKKQGEKVLLNQSGQGALIFGKTKALKELDFEDELWLEGAGYPLPEDQVMYYKLFLKGNKIVYTSEFRMIHLDAGTSITEDRKLKNLYASSRNGIIFWHRFIYKVRKNKLAAILGISRRVVNTSLIALCRGILKRDMSCFKTYIKGYKDGIAYLNTQEYHRLRPVCDRQ